jgi:hypothetical protein
MSGSMTSPTAFRLLARSQSKSKSNKKQLKHLKQKKREYFFH